MKTLKLFLVMSLFTVSVLASNSEPNCATYKAQIKDFFSSNENSNEKFILTSDRIGVVSFSLRDRKYSEEKLSKLLERLDKLNGIKDFFTNNLPEYISSYFREFGLIMLKHAKPETVETTKDIFEKFVHEIAKKLIAEKRISNIQINTISAFIERGIPIVKGLDGNCFYLKILLLGLGITIL